MQDAFVDALERWPVTGVPPSPAGWIVTTARNRAVDRFRRESVRDERHAEAERRLARDERSDEWEEERRARRPAAPDLHLLPSRARARARRSRSRCGCSAD